MNVSFRFVYELFVLITRRFILSRCSAEPNSCFYLQILLHPFFLNFNSLPSPQVTGQILRQRLKVSSDFFLPYPLLHNTCVIESVHDKVMEDLTTACVCPCYLSVYLTFDVQNIFQFIIQLQQLLFICLGYWYTALMSGTVETLCLLTRKVGPGMIPNLGHYFGHPIERCFSNFLVPRLPRWLKKFQGSLDLVTDLLVRSRITIRIYSVYIFFCWILIKQTHFFTCKNAALMLQGNPKNFYRQQNGRGTSVLDYLCYWFVLLLQVCSIFWVDQ
jgi:hypothetical protein